MRPGMIYTFGMISLGLAYYPIKAALTGPAHLFVVVDYALALRLVAVRLGTKPE